MPLEVSYSQARQRLASLLDEVADDREIVIIRRRNGESAALIAADELVSLTETAHLLRSPANASRPGKGIEGWGTDHDDRRAAG